jgi:thiosulfate/3-mercaptopyruvate sulfurtransferase
MTLTLGGLAVFLTLAFADKPAEYPRSELLIEVMDLVNTLPAKKFLILDARGKGSYLQGHIPTALWVDHNNWSRAFGEGKDSEAWAKRLGELGIEVDRPVVLYDANLNKDAARLWWILRYWGVRDVRLLNGGWKDWAAATQLIEKNENKATPVHPKLTPQANRLATKAGLLRSLEQKPQIIDTRSTGEYCGTEETGNKRNGAIPGAKHLEWSDTLDKATGRFKSPAELAKLFHEAGIDPSQPATTYCQSGGRAAVLAFVLELMGGKEVSNYYRSWSEWGNADDTPIDKPKPKK